MHVCIHIHGFQDPALHGVRTAQGRAQSRCQSHDNGRRACRRQCAAPDCSRSAVGSVLARARSPSHVARSRPPAACCATWLGRGGLGGKPRRAPIVDELSVPVSAGLSMPLLATAPKNSCACSTQSGRSRASKHVALEAGAAGASRHVARSSIQLYVARRGPRVKMPATAFYAYSRLAFLVTWPNEVNYASVQRCTWLGMPLYGGSVSGRSLDPWTVLPVWCSLMPTTCCWRVGPMGATLVNWRMSSTYRSSVLRSSRKAGTAESAQT